MVNVDRAALYGVIEGFFFLYSTTRLYNREKVKVVAKAMVWIFMNILKVMRLFKKRKLNAIV